MPDRRSPLATLLFASNFLRHPNMLGSIIPSSPIPREPGARADRLGRARVIVEYGPGVGTFTGEILRRMRSDAQLVAIETNRDFVRFLERRCLIRGCTWCTIRPPRCRRFCSASALPARALHHLRHSPGQHAGSRCAQTSREEPRGARARWRVSRLPVHCPGPACAAADLRRRAAQFRSAAICRRRRCSCARRPALSGPPYLSSASHLGAVAAGGASAAGRAEWTLNPQPPVRTRRVWHFCSGAVHLGFPVCMLGRLSRVMCRIWPRHACAGSS